MLASLLALRPRHAVFAAAAGLGIALLAPPAAADTPPDLPPLAAPPGAAPGAATAPATGAPGAPAAPRAPAPPFGYGAPPPGAQPAPPWMSPAEVPPGFPAQYPAYYPMPYPMVAPRQDGSELPAPPPRRYRSTGMFVGGVLMVSGGLVAVIAGAALVSSSANRIDIYCDTPSFPCAHKDDAIRKNGGATLMALGGIVGALGIPVWIVGAKMVPVPREERRPAFVPELRVGAGSARLTVSF